MFSQKKYVVNELRRETFRKTPTAIISICRNLPRINHMSFSLFLNLIRTCRGEEVA